MNYSFRKKNKIVKYIVIHYTGMKNLKLAYKKLSDKNSNVSAHYLISRNGIIFNLLCPKYKAWHAGKSKWKNIQILMIIQLELNLKIKVMILGIQIFQKNNMTH